MSLIPSRVIDHTDQGLALLLTQFKGKPRIAAWARAYLRQVQLLEDAAYLVLIMRLLDNAADAQLDAIGKIVGEPRGAFDDPNYRIFIAARIRINRSRGNTDDVLAVLALITTTGVRFAEFRTACLYFESLVIMDRDPVLIYTMLHQAKAGGVKLTLVVPSTNTHQFLPMTVGGSSVKLHAVGDALTIDDPEDILFDSEIRERAWFDPVASFFDDDLMEPNSEFGLASDCVSIRDPRALPVPKVGAPIVAFVDPSTGG